MPHQQRKTIWAWERRSKAIRVSKGKPAQTVSKIRKRVLLQLRRSRMNWMMRCAAFMPSTTIAVKMQPDISSKKIRLSSVKSTFAK